MLTGMLADLGTLTTHILTVMSGIVVLWPVAVMVAFLILGVGIGYIKRLAGKRGGRRKRRA